MTEHDQQIEKLLVRAREWIAKEVVCPRKMGICNHDNENCPTFVIDQALALIRKPTCETCPKCLAKDLTISNLKAVIEGKPTCESKGYIANDENA